MGYEGIVYKINFTEMGINLLKSKYKFFDERKDYIIKFFFNKDNTIYISKEKILSLIEEEYIIDYINDEDNLLIKNYGGYLLYNKDNNKFIYSIIYDYGGNYVYYDTLYNNYYLIDNNYKRHINYYNKIYKLIKNNNKYIFGDLNLFNILCYDKECKKNKIKIIDYSGLIINNNNHTEDISKSEIIINDIFLYKYYFLCNDITYYEYIIIKNYFYFVIIMYLIRLKNESTKEIRYNIYDKMDQIKEERLYKEIKMYKDIKMYKENKYLFDKILSINWDKYYKINVLLNYNDIYYINKKLDTYGLPLIIIKKDKIEDIEVDNKYINKYIDKIINEESILKYKILRLIYKDIKETYGIIYKMDDKDNDYKYLIRDYKITYYNIDGSNVNIIIKINDENNYKDIDLKKEGFIKNKNDIDIFRWYNINEIKSLILKWTIYFNENLLPYCMPCVDKNCLILINKTNILEQERIPNELLCIPKNNVFVNEEDKVELEMTQIPRFNCCDIYNKYNKNKKKEPIPIFKTGLLIINQDTKEILVGEKYNIYNTFTGTLYNKNYIDSSLIDLCALESDFMINTKDKLKKLDELVAKEGLVYSDNIEESININLYQKSCIIMKHNELNYDYYLKRGIFKSIEDINKYELKIENYEYKYLYFTQDKEHIFDKTEGKPARKTRIYYTFMIINVHNKDINSSKFNLCNKRFRRYASFDRLEWVNIDNLIKSSWKYKYSYNRGIIEPKVYRIVRIILYYIAKKNIIITNLITDRKNPEDKCKLDQRIKLITDNIINMGLVSFSHRIIDFLCNNLSYGLAVNNMPDPYILNIEDEIKSLNKYIIINELINLETTNEIIIFNNFNLLFNLGKLVEAFNIIYVIQKLGYNVELYKGIDSNLYFVGIFTKVAQVAQQKAQQSQQKAQLAPYIIKYKDKNIIIEKNKFQWGDISTKEEIKQNIYNLFKVNIFKD